jgi:hypothetical protein
MAKVKVKKRDHTMDMLAADEEKHHRARFREAVQYFASVGKDADFMRSSVTYIMNDRRDPVMTKKKLEFTYDDMKEIFMAGGANGGSNAHPMGFERVMRTSYPERYARKPKAKVA